METTVSLILEAGIASAYLALKLFLVFEFASFMQPRWALDRFSSLIAGWLLVQALQSGLVLGLSAVGLLKQFYFLTLILIFTALVYLRKRMLSLSRKTLNLSWLDHPALVAIGVVLVLMWLRSLFLYDFTWDAQTYGLPRLVLWLNSGSVFVHMPTLQLNLFVNEWNAELNALAFALVSGGYLGFAFGNLEVLLWLFVSIAWVSRLYGASAYWAIILSVVLGSTPAVIGLASTVKGDLLAITAFVIAVGWLNRAIREKTALALTLCLLSTTLAVGAKISVALPAIAIIFVALGRLGPRVFREISQFSVLTKSVLFLSLIVFSSRFWTNWTVYGNPLKRVAVEQAGFSFGNMFANLDLAGIKLFDILDEVQGNGTMWALAGSMGGAAWFIVVASLLVVIGALRNRWGSTCNSCSKTHQNDLTISNNWLTLVAGLILVSTLASMLLSPAYPWTFRYFAPGIFVLLIGAGALALRANPTCWSRRVLSTLAALVVLVNIGIAMRPGEVLPTADLIALTDEIKRADNPLKRMALLLKGPYQNAEVQALGLDTAAAPLKILAFKDVDTSILPFIGSWSQNNIQLVDNGNDLVTAAAKQGWDVVTIIQQMELRDRSLYVALESKGYVILVDNAQYLIALPRQRISLTPITDLKEVQWIPWNSKDDVRLEISDRFPDVQSARPVDIGFMTQQFLIQDLVLLRARFEGEISGVGSHAAHLSLHGKQSVITLPAGKYTSSQLYQGIFVAPEGNELQRLIFGLGGWAEGSGHIRLKHLEVFQLRVLGGNATLAPSAPKKLQPDLRLRSFTLAVFILGGCALFGRLLLFSLGVKNMSIMGGCTIIGYGVLGLLLLTSLKYLGNPMIGALIFTVVLCAMSARSFFSSRKAVDEHVQKPLVKIAIKTYAPMSQRCIKSRLIDSLVAVTLFSWLGATALVYIPLGWLSADAGYQFPDIFDLPKHLFAMHTLFYASNWPAPNPFFSGEIFAYNYLFYYPPVLIAMLVGNPLANFPIFLFAVIAVAIALPMVILDIVRGITTSKAVHLGSVLLSTWVGGLTPLWLSSKPSIGFFLFTEKFLTSQIWVDELFQSVIYVPQHVFAILCGLLIVFILLNNALLVTTINKRLFAAGVLTVTGALSSFIIIPHIVTTYVASAIVAIFLRWRANGLDTLNEARSPLTITILILPFIFLLPFLTEISKWSGVNGDMITSPELTKQWFYVLAALGLVVPLAMIGLMRLRPKAGISYIASPEKLTLLGISVMVVVGVLALLFGGYPDSGIKSGLWVRIALIPIAGIGLLFFNLESRKNSAKRIVKAAIAIIFIGLAVLNFPTAIYFVRSAWTPLDPGIKSLVSYVRGLPEHSRIALFSSEQVLVALTGRQVDFDFSPIREDSYMPPDGRHRAKIFWDGLRQNDPKTIAELNNRYDYLMAPVGSPDDERLALFFTARSSVGVYAIFETNKNDGEPK